MSQRLPITIAALTVTTEPTRSALTSIQIERDQPYSGAERLQAINDERRRIVDSLKEELVHVRKDKDVEIARVLRTGLR